MKNGSTSVRPGVIRVSISAQRLARKKLAVPAGEGVARERAERDVDDGNTVPTTRLLTIDSGTRLACTLVELPDCGRSTDVSSGV